MWLRNDVTGGWFGRLLLIILMLETGVVLMVVPWSVFWERNLFFEWFPVLEAPLTNYFVRGAVSGLGVVDVSAGLLDLAAMVLGLSVGESRHVSAARPEAPRSDDARPIGRGASPLSSSSVSTPGASGDA